MQSSSCKVTNSNFINSVISFYLPLLFRDHILVTGGYSWNSIIGKTESLNLTSKDAGNWKMLSNLNTPRYVRSDHKKITNFFTQNILSSSGPGQVQQVQGQRTNTWTWAILNLVCHPPTHHPVNFSWANNHFKLVLYNHVPLMIDLSI